MKVMRSLRRRTLVMLTALTLILSASSVLESVIIKYLTDAVTSYDRILFTWMLAAVPTYLVVDAFLHYVRQYRAALAGVQIQNNLRAELFRRIGLSPVARLTGRSSEYYFSQFTSQLESIKTNYIDVIFWGGYLTAQLIFAIVAAFILNPFMACAVLALSLPVGLMPVLIRKRIGAVTKTYASQTDALNEVSGDALRSALGWKILGAYSFVAKRFSEELSEWYVAARSYQRTQERVDAVNSMFTKLLYLGTWLAGGALVLSGLSSVGEVVAFAQLTGMICMPLFMSTGLLTQYYAGREIIRKIDAEVPAVEDDRPGEPLTLDAFTYRDVKPLGEKSAGYGVSFMFETGKKYLVIGASGSGKSTLFKPLFGNHPEYSGTIEVHESAQVRDLREIAEQDMHASLGLLAQDSHLLHDSLRENIRLYDPSVPDVQILRSCERAGLGEWASARGLDYMLSDDLRSLSGGEKQRILLARMLLHERSFYIVDELTTGLDHATAGRVERALFESMEGFVYITHRTVPEVLAAVDEVLVMEDGELVASGTWDDVHTAALERGLVGHP